MALWKEGEREKNTKLEITKQKTTSCFVTFNLTKRQQNKWQFRSIYKQFFCFWFVCLSFFLLVRKKLDKILCVFCCCERKEAKKQSFCRFALNVFEFASIKLNLLFFSLSFYFFTFYIRLFVFICFCVFVLKEIFRDF